MSLSPNKYSNGSQKAVMTDALMKAPKWQPGQSYYGRGIGLLNIAFKLYYDARTGINSCPDSKQQSEMLDTLEGCATDGWGWGVTDLDDAFQHLIKNNDTWTDTNARSYSGVFQQSLGGPCMDVPQAAVEFCSSVESKMKTLTQIFTEFNTQSDNVTKAVDTSNWELIQVALKNMKDNGGKAKKLMWVAPAKVKDVLGKPLEKATSFVDALNEIDTAVRNIDKYKSVGMNDTAAGGLELMRIAAGKVPVLGAFYSEMIGQLPDFFVNMKQVFEDRQNKILAIAHMQ